MYYYTGDIVVDVALADGLYVFRPESAAGKTYMGNLLEALASRGENVRYYTYRDHRNGHPLPTTAKLLFVDRVDMFPEVIPQLRNLPGIVLIDYKQSASSGIPRVRIRYKPNEVHVGC